MRPYQVWRHRLGEEVTKDKLVLQEDDERFELGVELSKSESYIFFTSSSQVTSECRFVRSEAPDEEAVLIEPRRAEIEYSVDHQEDRFLILTNDGDLAHTLAHPSFGVTKTYVAKVRGRMTAQTVAKVLGISERRDNFKLD